MVILVVVMVVVCMRAGCVYVYVCVCVVVVVCVSGAWKGRVDHSLLNCFVVLRPDNIFCSNENEGLE